MIPLLTDSVPVYKNEFFVFDRPQSDEQNEQRTVNPYHISLYSAALHDGKSGSSKGLGHRHKSFPPVSLFPRDLNFDAENAPLPEKLLCQSPLDLP